MNPLNNLLNYFNNTNNSMNFQLLNKLNRGGNCRRKREYNIKKRVDPMAEYSRRDFKKRFRFYKDEVEYLYHLIDGPNTLDPIVNYLSFCKKVIANCEMEFGVIFTKDYSCYRPNARGSL